MFVSFRRLVVATVAGVSVLALGGCESFTFFDDNKPFVANETPADQLYNQGLAALNKREYTTAIKNFIEVERQHPYSDYGRRSLVLAAFAAFEKGDYPETVTQAKRFLQLNPSHKDAAYAQFLLASAYYNQMPDASRDQEQTEKALQAFQELVQRYPSSEYVNDSKQKIVVLKDQLAAKEMTVGRFYLKQRNFIGAVNRFRTVVSQHQTTRHVEEALYRLTEAYMAMGVVPEAQTAAAVLGHNFPDSQWYAEAHKRLAGSGLEPKEDTGSWISRAFRRVAL